MIQYRSCDFPWEDTLITHPMMKTNLPSNPRPPADVHTCHLNLSRRTWAVCWPSPNPKKEKDQPATETALTGESTTATKNNSNNHGNMISKYLAMKTIYTSEIRYLEGLRDKTENLHSSQPQTNKIANPLFFQAPTIGEDQNVMTCHHGS